MLLQIENLHKKFGGISAINGVSFGVEKGELSSIIGPNGAGKSTLFNLLTGFLPKDSGKVIFKGEEISNLPPYEICKRKIGRSFQLVSLFQRLPVFDNIRIAILAGKGLMLDFFKPARKMVREETERLLESIGLASKALTSAADLAHGEQRRLELGIALANKPELLFLDEPCSGLTVEESNIMIELIRKLAAEQELTVLLVEHKMDMVFSISRKIRVLHEGRLIFEGGPQEVKSSEIVQKVYLGEER
jgi:branched-chain amino acid transport system ATP-binding protein